MSTRWFFPALLGMACLAAAFVHAQAPLHVAAAADLEPLLPPILEQFRQATGIRAEAAFQASAVLATQIQNGAPFDLFLSADLGYPKRLIDAGLADAAGSADSSTPIVYARGTLVLWARKDSPLPPPSLDLLRNPNLKRLAVANPERAPYGRAAVSALTRLELYDDLKPRLVTAENISQAAQFVDSGNADAGLISLTSALTPRLQADGVYFVVPHELYPPIEQGAVIVSKTSQRDAAHKLLDYLLSPAVQAQLAKSGLTPFTRNNGLASARPHHQARFGHYCDSARRGRAAGGSAGVGTQPLAGFCRGAGSVASGPAAHCPWLLSAGPARASNRRGARHHRPHWPPPRLFLLRPGSRIRDLQPALCRSAPGRRF